MIHCTKNILAYPSDKIKVKQQLMVILERYGVLAVIFRCLDRLSASDLKDYFASLIETHSWSIVKLDRCGL